ncbi:hypothetical protein [Vibrio alginolyticus]
MKKIRVQFDLTEDKVKEIEEIMEKSGMSSRKDVFNTALTLLEWAIEESERGHDIAAINRSEREFFSLRMPVLESAKKKQQTALAV